jgi:hypothetical protein
MLIARGLAGVRGAVGRVCVSSLPLVLIALVPLAHASPPDPLWIAGIYDAADADDVVSAVTSVESVVEHGPPGLSSVTTLRYILPAVRVRTQSRRARHENRSFR